MTKSWGVQVLDYHISNCSSKQSYKSNKLIKLRKKYQNKFIRRISLHFWWAQYIQMSENEQERQKIEEYVTVRWMRTSLHFFMSQSKLTSSDTFSAKIEKQLVIEISINS